MPMFWGGGPPGNGGPGRGMFPPAEAAMLKGLELLPGLSAAAAAAAAARTFEPLVEHCFGMEPEEVVPGLAFMSG